MSHPRRYAPVVALALLLVGGALLLRGWLADPLQRLDLADAVVFSPPRPLPQFTLLDQRGEIVGRDRLAGQWELVFFGFTHCPDVCPVTLQILANVRAQLAQDAGRPAPGLVFVSVDAARDDPAALASYVGYFDAEILALTGRSQEDIRPLTDAMDVAVGFGAPDREGHYDILHTAAVFLVSPAAELVAAFPGDPDSMDFPTIHNRHEIVHDLRLIFDARE